MDENERDKRDNIKSEFLELRQSTLTYTAHPRTACKPSKIAATNNRNKQQRSAAIATASSNCSNNRSYSNSKQQLQQEPQL